MEGLFRDVESIKRIFNMSKKVIIFSFEDDAFIEGLLEKLSHESVGDCLLILHSSNKKVSVNGLTCDSLDVTGLYHLYEFSDNIFEFSDTSQYGNLINYLNAGILTLDEFVEALTR